MFKGENGHRYIDVGGGLDKLPSDSVWRVELDENGYYDLDADGHSIEDAVKTQGEIRKAVQADARNKADFAKKKQAALDKFRREALEENPTDGTRRAANVKNKMDAWLKENDPDYEKRQQQSEREREKSIDNLQPTATMFMM